MLLLEGPIKNYHFVSQGKTTIPGVDDREEMEATDVSDDVTGSVFSRPDQTAVATARGATVARRQHRSLA